MYMHKTGWKEAEFRGSSLNVSFDEYSSYELDNIHFLIYHELVVISVADHLTSIKKGS